MGGAIGFSIFYLIVIVALMVWAKVGEKTENYDEVTLVLSLLLAPLSVILLAVWVLAASGGC